MKFLTCFVVMAIALAPNINAQHRQSPGLLAHSKTQARTQPGHVTEGSYAQFLDAFAAQYHRLLEQRVPIVSTTSYQTLDHEIDSLMRGVYQSTDSLASQQNARGAVLRLGSFSSWWPTLTPGQQVRVAPRVAKNVLDELELLAVDPAYTALADRYAQRILAANDEAWASRVYGRDSMTRVYRNVGAQFGDSLRYRGEVLLDYYRERGTLHTLRGQCALIRGDTTRAMAYFADAMADWYATTERGSPQFTLGVQLSTLHEARGDLPGALRYAGDAYIAAPRSSAGSPPKTLALEQRFARLYQRVFGDSSEQNRLHYLDSLSVHDFAAHGGAHGSPNTAHGNGHTVLLTTETWVDCGGCRIRDDAFDALLDRFNQRDVVIFVNHYMPPFVTPGAREVHGMYDVVSAYGRRPRCLLIIDGECSQIPDSIMPALNAPLPVYDVLNRAVMERLTQPRRARIRVDVASRNGVVSAHVQVDSVMDSVHPLKVQILLVEDSIHYNAYNHVRVWRMVPRAIAGDSATGFGFSIRTTDAQTFDATFDLARVSEAVRTTNAAIRALGETKYSNPPVTPEELVHWNDVAQLDAKHLGVIVLVNDPGIGNVLETVYTAVPSS